MVAGGMSRNWAGAVDIAASEVDPDEPIGIEVALLQLLPTGDA
jgi:hypothetical protein